MNIGNKEILVLAIGLVSLGVAILIQDRQIRDLNSRVGVLEDREVVREFIESLNRGKED